MEKMLHGAAIFTYKTGSLVGQNVSHMLHGAATFTYKTGSFMGQNVSHMLHVCYIYLQNWVIYGAHVRKYSMHGASGYVRNMKT